MIVMASIADAKQAANTLLDDETVDAWRDYVKTTREAGLYDEVEPWAWTQLQRRLDKIQARRDSLQ